MIFNTYLLTESVESVSWQLWLTCTLLASGPQCPCWDPSSWTNTPHYSGSSLLLWCCGGHTRPISRVCCSLSAVSCELPKQHWSAGRPNISRSVSPGSPRKPPPPSFPVAANRSTDWRRRTFSGTHSSTVGENSEPRAAVHWERETDVFL